VQLAELGQRLDKTTSEQYAALEAVSAAAGAATAAERALAEELHTCEESAAQRHAELSAMVIDVGSAADAALNDLSEAIGHERQRWMTEQEELAAGLADVRQRQREDRAALEPMLARGGEDEEARCALRSLSEEMVAERHRQLTAEEALCSRLEAVAREHNERHEALQELFAECSRSGVQEARDASPALGPACQHDASPCTVNEPAIEQTSLASTTATFASSPPTSPTEAAAHDAEADITEARRSHEEELSCMRAQDPRELRAAAREATALSRGLWQLAAEPFAAWRRFTGDAWARRAVRSACVQYRTRVLTARALAGLAEHMRAQRDVKNAVEQVLEQWAADRRGEKLRTAFEAWKRRAAGAALGRRGADSMERWARSSHLRSVLWAWRDACPG